MNNDKPTILVVDDESIVCRVAAAVLSSRGYQVVIANGGIDGLQKFSAHKDEVKLVVSDINMPDLSGPEMVDLIRQEQPHVNILFISGAADVLPNWAEGTCGVLVKPFLAGKLVETVEKCLHSSSVAA
jgi:two-component system cell cycle sensor histidine kinase/response regulator CckA